MTESPDIDFSIDLFNNVELIDKGIFDSIKRRLACNKVYECPFINYESGETRYIKYSTIKNDLILLDEWIDVSMSGMEGISPCPAEEGNLSRFLDFSSNELKMTNFNNGNLEVWQEKSELKAISSKIIEFKRTEAILDSFSTQLDFKVEPTSEIKAFDSLDISIKERLEKAVNDLCQATKNLTDDAKVGIAKSFRESTYRLKKFVSKLISNLTKVKVKIIKKSSCRYRKIDIRRETRKFLKLLFRSNADEENITFKIEFQQFSNLIFNCNVNKKRNHRIIRLPHYE